MILPSWWRGASFQAKADFLVRTGHAEDFSQACSLLAMRKKKPPPPPPPDMAKVRLPYKDEE